MVSLAYKLTWIWKTQGKPWENDLSRVFHMSNYWRKFVLFFFFPLPVGRWSFFLSKIFSMDQTGAEGGKINNIFFF